MRLRNIPGAGEIVQNSEFSVTEPEKNKGNWKEFLGNNNPIHIEIGMGKGQFLMELAMRHPDINYLGIEKYTSVILRAVQKLETLEIKNIKLLCIDAENLPEIFAEEEIDRIYLNFSDPWPKDRHAKRRLTSKEFLERYDKVLSHSGRLEFKTDNKKLFEFSVEEVKETKWNLDVCTFDLHNDSMLSEGNVMTEYEEKFSKKGNPIHKMIITR